MKLKPGQTRLAQLKAKLAAREGNPMHEGKNLEAIRAEIARLETKPERLDL